MRGKLVKLKLTAWLFTHSDALPRTACFPPDKLEVQQRRAACAGGRLCFPQASRCRLLRVGRSCTSWPSCRARQQNRAIRGACPPAWMAAAPVEKGKTAVEELKDLSSRSRTCLNWTVACSDAETQSRRRGTSGRTRACEGAQSAPVSFLQAFSCTREKPDSQAPGQVKPQQKFSEVSQYVSGRCQGKPVVRAMLLPLPGVGGSWS